MKLQYKSAGSDKSNKLFNDNFTIDELKQAILNLKNGKKPGPDNIISEFLQHLGPTAKNTLLKLINQIWHKNIP